MGLLSCLIKLIIGIINSLLISIGFTLMIIGAFLLWGVNFFIKNIYDLQGQIQRFLKVFNIQIDETGVISLIQQNTGSIGTISFFVGIIVMAIGIIGIIAICCCTLKLLFVSITISLIVLTLGLIILVSYYGADSSTRILIPLVSYLQKDIINKYEDINSTTSESILVNVVQISAKCCGLYNYSDFINATKFNRKAYDSTNKVYKLEFPLSCCDYQQDFIISASDRDHCIRTSTSKDMNVGCWNKLQPYFIKYLNYCFAIIGITIAILIISIIATIIVIKCLDKITGDIAFTPVSIVL